MRDEAAIAAIDEVRAQRDELQGRIDSAVLLIERAPYSRAAAAAMRILTPPRDSPAPAGNETEARRA